MRKLSKRGGQITRRQYTYLVFAVAFAAIGGFILLKGSHAATPTPNTEAENGTANTNAASVADSTASNAHAVSFSAPATQGTGTADGIHYTLTGANSVSFDWRGTATSIHYGTTTSYGSSANATGPVVVKEDGSSVVSTPNSGPGPFREARLSGLQANTTYHYSIGTNSDKTFHTAPAAGSSGFSVIVEGDIGNPAGFPDMQTIQNMIASANPSLVLLAGDFPYDNASPTDGQIDAFYGDAGLGASKNGIEAFSLTTPTFPAWGNHEIDHANDNGTCTGDNLSNYKSRFDFPNPKEDPVYATYCNTGGGEDWYWFDYGNTRFIAYPEPWADDWATWNSKVDPIMSQAQANSNIKYIVTFGHRPAYSSGYHPGESALLNYTTALHGKYSKYIMNLNGHSHSYERTVPAQTGGITHLTVGTGGGYLENGTCSNGWNPVNSSCNAPSWSAFRLMRYGYLKLTFNAGSITGQFVCGPPGGDTVYDTCTQGTVVDNFTL